MKSNLFNQMNITLSFRVILSALFLISAAAKLYPSPYFALTTFEMKQLLPMGFNETTAAYFSRTLIGCELALGILLLQPHYYRKLVLPVSFLLLLIFSSHLSYEILTTGNKGNCGCFGSLMPMTPLQALIKNIVAMGMIIYLFKLSSKESDKNNFSLLMTVTFASILFIYLLGPIARQETKVQAPVTISDAEIIRDKPALSDKNNDVPKPSPTNIEGKTLEKNQIKAPKIEEPASRKSGYSNYFLDIDKGKKVLCFFAPGCDHCRETVKELTQLKKQISNFPEIRILFMDEEAEKIPDFFAFAGSNYPYQLLDIISFWKAIGSSKDTPGVVYLWNGNTFKFYEGINENKFKKNEFKFLVQKPFKELIEMK